MRQWITGVFSASLLASIALALCPSGRVRGVTRMVCGIVCALALVSPLISADIGKLAVSLAAYEQQARRLTENEEEAEKLLERTYIEEKCAAYILGRAETLNADVSAAAVRARWDEEQLVWYPWEAAVTGAYSAAVAGAIEAELGIPPERQAWSDE